MLNETNTLPPAANQPAYLWLVSMRKLRQSVFVSLFLEGTRVTIRFEFLTGGVIVFLRSNRGFKPPFLPLSTFENLRKACNIGDHAVRE